jgi:hypothetical protein
MSERAKRALKSVGRPKVDATQPHPSVEAPHFLYFKSISFFALTTVPVVPTTSPALVEPLVA